MSLEDEIFAFLGGAYPIIDPAENVRAKSLVVFCASFQLWSCEAKDTLLLNSF
jgi:hypothetical protein